MERKFSSGMGVNISNYKWNHNNSGSLAKLVPVNGTSQKEHFRFRNTLSTKSFFFLLILLLYCYCFSTTGKPL